MRSNLNKINFCGEVVIGEGELDKAPMLYIGEKLGKAKEPKIDLALDHFDNDFEEDEIRLFRIKFLSEVAN